MKYRKSFIKQPRRLFISSPFEGGGGELIEMGDGGETYFI